MDNDLLIEIENFLSETGMGPCAFGAKAVGNGKLVGRLRAGRDIGLVTAKRIREFIARQRQAPAPSSMEVAQ